MKIYTPLFILILSILMVLTGSLWAQPVNDDCTNATVLTNLTVSQTVSIDLTNATESLKASCENANNNNRDVWFSFTMPFNGKLRISSVIGSNRIGLFSSCGGTELRCETGFTDLDSLNNGTTYLLRYAGHALATNIDDIIVQAFPLAPNNDCSTAIQVPNIVVQQQIMFDNRIATESLDASCDNASNENLDLWYTFTMPFDGKVGLNGISSVSRVSLYDSCGGIERNCFIGNPFFDSLEVGQTYFLRYSSPAQFSGSGTLSIQAFSSPGNNICAQATTISGIQNKQTLMLNNAGASESLDVSCENAADDNLDVWYQFVMPFDGKIRITGLSTADHIALFDQCGGIEIACKQGPGFLDSLTSGLSYQLRIASEPQFAGDKTFTIQAFAPPVNDLCINAITLNNLVSQQNIQLDTRGAFESLKASCDNSGSLVFDLWYTFVMPVNGKVVLTGLSAANRVALFDGCGGTELACLNGPGFFDQLVQGNTYYIRYGVNANQSTASVMGIQAFSEGGNDECTDAIQIGDISTLQTINLDTRQASQSVIASCEDSTKVNLDMWYRFTMPFSGKVNISDVFGLNRIVLFDSCGGSELGCLTGNGFFENLANGESYVLRYAANSTQAGTDDFTIQAFPNSLNDECSEAILVPDMSFPQTIQLDTRQATESIDASCEDSTKDNLDLWYRFVMPFDGQLEVRDVDGGNRWALFDSCGGEEVFCSVGNGNLNGLRGGREYIFRYASLSTMANTEQFSMQAFPHPPNDSCEDAQLITRVDSMQIIQVDTRRASESRMGSCDLTMEKTSGCLVLFYYAFQRQDRSLCI